MDKIVIEEELRKAVAGHPVDSFKILCQFKQLTTGYYRKFLAKAQWQGLPLSVAENVVEETLTEGSMIIYFLLLSEEQLELCLNEDLKTVTNDDEKEKEKKTQSHAALKNKITHLKRTLRKNNFCLRTWLLGNLGSNTSGKIGSALQKSSTNLEQKTEMLLEDYAETAATPYFNNLTEAEYEADQAIISNQLTIILNQLSPADRQLYRMRAEGYDYKEIARQLEIPAPHLRVRYCTLGRELNKKLRQRLKNIA